ncbi:MAG: aldo/keto reductase [Chloroflexota bacterium]|nr:aldo/keto reductase [Chloroflexota bacterium]
MERRQLGRTGVEVPILGYGTATLGHIEADVPMDAGVAALNHAIDRGITYLDTSPDYGSEPIVGEVMKTRRSEVFLATKCNLRTRDGVLRDMHDSLERLQTDHVDLLQIHAVNTHADLEAVLAPDGSIPGVEEARRQGLCRFVGITGHARPDVLARAIQEYPFDTVLVALGAADRLVSKPETVLLPVARERGTGVIAMKVLLHGEIDLRDLALRYSLGLDGVSLAIVGMKNQQEVDSAVDVAENFRPLSEQEEEQLIARAQELVHDDAQKSQQGEQGPLFWLRDTSTLAWTYDDEPALVAY